MDSKKINIIEIFLHIASILLLFMPRMFYCYLSDKRVVNAFTDLPSGAILPIIFVILIFISLFLCVQWGLSKNKKSFNIVHIILPIFSVGVFCLIGMLYTQGEYETLVELLSATIDSHTNLFTLGPIYFFELIILVSILIMSIIKRNQYCKYNINDVEIKDNNFENDNFSRNYECPQCKNKVEFGVIMCEKCGQKFDWSKL